MNKFLKKAGCILLSLAMLAGCAPMPSQQGQGNTNKPVGNSDLYSFFAPTSSTYTSAWSQGDNTGKLNQDVEVGVRSKRTKILGNNKDQITIMVYMCGSDLESRGKMASLDLQEMASAAISNNINLLVYTGGTTKWHINSISTKYNQIYRINGNGQAECIVENAGNGAMTDPNNLVSFVNFCTKNYKANRYELIFWDHGAGSTGGYGNDEKYPKVGSMSLDQIDQALSRTGVKFDFIGFDACLMGNTETAIMTSEYADYLIASEEAEPGIGWYYTDWLTALSKNTSMPTLEIGKNIVDSFVSTCQAKTPRQAATLSVIDLAEAGDIIPDLLADFASTTSDSIINNDYKKIANARSSSREFAKQANVELVDLVDFASKVNSKEGKELSKALLNCVKYNKVSSDMANSYGMSIYFPYRTSASVRTVLNMYNNLDFSKEYSKCLTNFVNYATTAQAGSGGQHSVVQSTQQYNSNNYYQSQNSTENLMNVVNLLMGATPQQSTQQSSGADYSALINFGLNALLNAATNKSIVQYVVDNHFDADLTWKDGKIALTKDQWSLVDDLKLNMFVDDGEGYIDLGKDCIFDIDEDGNLLAVEDFTWLAASVDEENYQVIPFYYLYNTEVDGNMITTGRVPVLYNGDYANLIIQLDDEGIEVVGITYDYKQSGAPVAKALTELAKGDELEFVCNYYTYDGEFSDTYILGDKIVIQDQLYIGDVDIVEYDLMATYEFVDIYQQSYWTTPM